MSPQQLAHISRIIRQATKPETAAREFVEALAQGHQTIYVMLPRGLFMPDDQPPQPELIRWLKNPDNWRGLREPEIVDNILLMPLYYSGRVQGVAAMSHSDDDTIAVLLADVLAARLDELYTAQLTYRMRQLIEEINQAGQVSDVLQTTVTGLTAAFDYQAAAILKFEPDDDRGEIIAEHPTRLLLGRDMGLDDYDRIKYAFQNDDIIVYEGNQDSLLTPQIRLAMRAGGYRQFMAVPMHVHGEFIGALIGMLAVSATTRQFTGRERELCAMLGQVVGNAYSNARRMRYEAGELDDALFRQVIDEANVAVDIADSSGAVIYKNHAWNKMFLTDRPAGDLTNGDDDDIFYYEDRLQKDEKLLRDDVIFPKATRTIGWTSYLTLQRQSGETFDAHISVTALRDNRDRVVGYSTITDDVTELHHVMESLQQQTARLAAASRISQVIISRRDEQDLMKEVLRRICRQFKYQAGQILEVNDTHTRLIACAAYTAATDDIRLEPGVSIALDTTTALGRWWQTDSRTGVIDDVSRHKRYYPAQPLPDGGSEMAVLLRASDNTLGVLVIQSHQPGAFQLDDIDILQTIADQLAVAWDNARLFTALHKRLDDMNAMSEVSLLVQSSFQLRELAQRLYDAVRRVHQQGEFTLAIRDDDAAQLHIMRFTHGTNSQIQHIYRSLQPDPADLLSEIIQQGQPVFWQSTAERQQTAQRFDHPPADLPASYMGQPLIAKDRVLGAMTMQGDTAGLFDNDDQQFFLTLANSAAFGIENMQLLEATQRRMQETEILYNISHTLAQTFDQDALWNVLLTEINELFPHAVVTLAFYDRPTSTLQLPDGIPDTILPPPTLSRVVIHNSITLHFEDLHHEHERLQSLGVEPDDYDTGMLRSWVGTPLRSRNGESTGVMCLQSDQPYAFDARDVSLLNTLAAQVSLSVDNARLLEAEQQRRQLANSLIDIGRVITSTLNVSAVFERLLNQMGRIVRYDRALILMLPAEAAARQSADTLAIRAAEGFDILPDERNVSFAPDSLLSQLIKTRQPIVVSSVANDERWQPLAIYTGLLPPKSWVGVPLVMQSDVIGIITVERMTADDPYTMMDGHMAFALGRQVAIAVSNARLHSAAEQRLAQLKTRNRRLASLHRMAMMINSTLEQGDILSRAAELLTDLFNVDHAGIIRLDARDDNGYLVAEYPAIGLRGKPIIIHNTASYTMLMQLFQKNQTVQITPDNIDQLLGKDHAGRSAFDRIQAGTTLLAPMIMQDEILGSIALSTSDSRHIFTGGDREIFITMTSQIAMAINNAELYEQALESSRLKGEFLANISHELRTPLSAIMGYSELLLSSVYGEMNERQLDRVERIYRNGRNLLALINDILDLSKIEAGRMTLEQMEVDMEDMIRDVLSVIEDRLEKAGLDLRLDIDDDLPRIPADPNRLRQIIMNLLTNAVKFTEAGYIAVRARLLTPADNPQAVLPALPPDMHITDGNWLFIEVEDTGIGISASDQSIIFDAFRQVDGSSVREYEGTGLGLAITRRLLTMHNGYIWLQSEPGVGSTFYVLLPTQAGQVALPDTVQNNARPLVLVLDEDEKTLSVLANYMRADGYEVVTTSDPQRFLQLAANLQPRAIVMDILLPDVDGTDVIAELKTRSHTASIPVVIVSSMDKREAQDEIGAAAYLLKPVPKAQLLHTLAALVVDTPSS